VQDLFKFQYILKPTRYRGEDTPNLLDLVLLMMRIWLKFLLISLGWGAATICAFPTILLLLRVRLYSQRIYLNIMCMVMILMIWGYFSVLTEMADLSLNDCWDYFSTTFDEIMRTCVPLAKAKKKHIRIFTWLKELWKWKIRKIVCGELILHLNLLNIVSLRQWWSSRRGANCFWQCDWYRWIMSTPHTLLYTHVIATLHHTILISVSVIYCILWGPG